MNTELMKQHAHYKAVRARLNGHVVSRVILPKPDLEPKPEPEPELEPEPEPVVPVDLMHGVLCSDEVKDAINPLLRYYNMSWSHLISKTRNAKIIEIRAKVYFILRKRKWSYPKIAKMCGNRDHTTIRHSILKSIKQEEMEANQ